MNPKPLTKDDVLRAMKMTKSNKAAARYLHCSYQHYIKYSKLYTDEATGKTLHELHKNQAGKGIPKFISGKGKQVALKDIFEGKVPIEHFTPEKMKGKLIAEGYLEEKCKQCGFNERRVIDYKIPLLLNFKDNNKKNYSPDNIQLLCYNCFFLYVGDVFTNKQLKGIEDFVVPNSTYEADWELDEHFKEHFKQLGLMDEHDKDDNSGEEFVSKI